MIAWLGERRTISLDGLANTYEYQEVLRERRLSDYLKQNGVTHVVTLGHYLLPGGGATRVPIPSRRYWPEGDAMVLRPEASVFVAAGGGVRVWRYDPDPLAEDDR